MRTAIDELIAGSVPTRCVVIAELGVNHNGSVQRALHLLECAHQAGADAVKLQLFEPGELCSRVHRRDEQKMLAALRLSDAEHERICAAARGLRLPVFATPFDEPSLRLLERLEIPVVKVGSGDVTHTPFLARIAALGRPVILSTGGCELSDVDRAVHTLWKHGCRHLNLLHCVSAYPPPDEQVYLRVIPALTERYLGCAIGFSDHSLGLEAGVAAVALGARIIEKHLTLDRDDEGPDHAASADPQTFAALVTAIHRTEQMLGSGAKTIQPCEGTIGRSVVAARDLSAGHVLNRDDVAYRRPGTGLRPHDVDRLLGRRLAHTVASDAMLSEADVV